MFWLGWINWDASNVPMIAPTTIRPALWEFSSKSAETPGNIENARIEHSTKANMVVAETIKRAYAQRFRVSICRTWVQSNTSTSSRGAEGGQGNSRAQAQVDGILLQYFQTCSLRSVNIVYSRRRMLVKRSYLWQVLNVTMSLRWIT